MSDSDPFAAHPPVEVTGRWARVGATADEAAILPPDGSVAHLADGDLRQILDDLRADAVEVDGEGSEAAQDAPDDAETTDTAEPSDDGADDAQASDADDASQVTPDSE